MHRQEDMVVYPINSRNVPETDPTGPDRSGQIMLANNRDLPPPYEVIIEPNGIPPSYESLFGHIREIHRPSRAVYFLELIEVLIIVTISFIIMFGLMVIPIAAVVIGGLYFNDCPLEEYIPIYLLVFGGCTIFKCLCYQSVRVCWTVSDEEIQRTLIWKLLDYFEWVWFIVGSMWVYKLYKPNYDPSFGRYCNKTLYLFAFSQITIVYIILALRTFRFFIRMVVGQPIEWPLQLSLM